MNTFEERLLTELKAVVAEQAGQVGGEKTRRITSLPTRRSRLAGPPWRPRGPVAAGIAVSLALAGALAGTELVATNAARPAPSQYSLVADFLNKAAGTARAQHVAQPGPGQLYYTLSQVSEMVGEIINGHLLNPPACEISWYDHAGRPVMNAIYTNFSRLDKGTKDPCATVSVTPSGKRSGPIPRTGTRRPHRYRTIRTSCLPSSTRQRRGAGCWNMLTAPRDQIVFTLVERLLQAPISGDLRAALYQATIDIPGVMLDPHATDALGRPGTGVFMRLPGRDRFVFIDEFILAKNTFTFLGTRMTWEGASPTETAVMKSGIVKADGS